MAAKGQTNRHAGRPRKFAAPTDDDINLILECKVERQRMRAELDQLVWPGKSRKPRRKEDALRVQRLRRDIKQLTDESLAEKFEQSKYVIQGI